MAGGQPGMGGLPNSPLPPGHAGGGQATLPPLAVLYEDNFITVCIKSVGVSSEDVFSPLQPPAGGVATASKSPNFAAAAGQKKAALPAMPALLRAHWGRPAAYVGVVHRLDAGVSGVMVYARTPKAAAALSAQVAGRRFEKEYLCICAGVPAPPAGRMEDYLFKDSRKGKVFPVKSARKGAKPALLEYEVLAAAPLAPAGEGVSAASALADRAASAGSEGQTFLHGLPGQPGAQQAAPAGQAPSTVSPLPFSFSGALGQTSVHHSAPAAPAVHSAPPEPERQQGPAPTVPNPGRPPDSLPAQAALCRVVLHTGRTHQIRVQFASRKHPLLGDGKYGSRVKGPLALACCRIAFAHPQTGQWMEFTAPPPGGQPWALFSWS